MNSAKLRASTDAGMSILIGSVDQDGNPACCRGVALTAPEDFSSATVFVPVETSRDTIRNVATTHRIAVVASHPIDHTSIQLKGSMQAIRLAEEAEQSMIRDRIEAFRAILDRIGVPGRVTRRFNHWPAFAIEFSIEETYDQTPGPKAGTQLQ